MRRLELPLSEVLREVSDAVAVEEAALALEVASIEVGRSTSPAPASAARRGGFRRVTRVPPASLRGMTLRPARLLLTALALGLTAAMPRRPAGAPAPAPRPLRPRAPVATDLFTPLGELPLSGPKVRVEPTDYAAFRLDVRAVCGRQLADAPDADAAAPGAALEVEIPDPSGELQRFDVVEDVGDGARARGRCTRRSGPTPATALDDPRPQHPDGRHADGLPRLGAQPRRVGAWYVDPAYNRRGETRHLSYYGAAVPAVAPRASSSGTCRRHRRGRRRRRPSRSALPAATVTRRTYRLAFVTDPTYATYFGAANVSAEKATLINRVNQVYKDDLAIQFVLVADTDQLNLDTAALATGPQRSLRRERLLHPRPSWRRVQRRDRSTATSS